MRRRVSTTTNLDTHAQPVVVYPTSLKLSSSDDFTPGDMIPLNNRYTTQPSRPEITAGGTTNRRRKASRCQWKPTNFPVPRSTANAPNVATPR